MTGLGLITGPIIGSSLYSLLGYGSTFFLYGSLLMILSFVIKLNFPEQNDVTDEYNDDEFEYSKNEMTNDGMSSYKNSDSGFDLIKMR